MAINRGEINSVTDDASIVWPLDCDIDARTRLAQADRVPLLQTRNPDLLVEFKSMIRMRPVGLGRGNLAIVGLPGESFPRILAQYIPFLHHASLYGDFDYHVESGDDYQKRSPLRLTNVMEIIEAGQGNIVLQA